VVLCHQQQEVQIQGKLVARDTVWTSLTDQQPTISQVEEQVRPGSQARDVPEHEPVGKIPKTDLCYGVEVGKLTNRPYARSVSTEITVAGIHRQG
jgi:hypothetical protein